MFAEIQVNFFAPLRSVFNGREMTAQEKEEFNSEALPKLFGLARKHDIAHLLGLGLEKNGLLEKGSEASAKFQRENVTAVYRYEQLNYEYESLCEIFTKLEIPFIPLKGSVIRKYYPEPWMRTSSDVDILVHKEDYDRAVAYLKEKCEYEEEATTEYNVALLSPAGMHVEVHHDLIEDAQNDAACKLLRRVWESVSLKEGCAYHYEMSDDTFYFYHIAHMAKHFESGGCGIRPFIDLWILDGLEGVDQTKREETLARGGLLKFSRVMRKLSRVWFEGEEADDVVNNAQEYVLRGGVYGTADNQIAVRQQKKGGRFRDIMSRVFLPYKQLKRQYPVLVKHPWLTPIMHVRRWCRLLFCGQTKRVMNDLKKEKEIWNDRSESTKSLLEDVGL